MSASEVPSWSALVSLMVHGPDVEPTVRGTIRSVDPTDSRGLIAFGHSLGEPEPVIVGSGTWTSYESGTSEIRVWRDGPRVRVEEPDGSPNLIVGEGRMWSFDKLHEAPLESLRAHAQYGIRGTGLLWRRDAEGFLGRDFTRLTGPIGSTSFLGRPAWTLELAPPASKPHPIQLVVDAATGLLLQQRNDGFGTVDEWTEFVVGEELDPSLFVWTGPSRSEADEHAARMAVEEADQQRRRDWVRTNVLAQPLRVELNVDLWLHEWDDETGAFEASLSEGAPHGSLARRPVSSDPWDLPWHEVQHRWSDDRWDWALTVWEIALAPGAIEALKRQLSGDI